MRRQAEYSLRDVKLRLEITQEDKVMYQMMANERHAGGRAQEVGRFDS
jgi:hypothetical protein